MSSQNWYERARNCLSELETKTFPHWCWTIFDTSLEQLLRQSEYEKMIRQPITWGLIMVVYLGYSSLIEQAGHIRSNYVFGFDASHVRQLSHLSLPEGSNAHSLVS